MKKILFFLVFIGCLISFSIKITAQSISKDPTQISQKSDDGIIIAYPNPARDFVVIKLKDAALKIKSVTFYSILGVQVAEYSVNMNSGELRLDRLRPGKYLMKYILSDNTQKVTQIVKQ
jgi:hypothetical protein